jgi:hypothetical protein
MQSLSYMESIRLGWMLFWRAMAAFFGLIYLSNVVLLLVMPELTRSGPSVWTLAMPLGLAASVSLFGIMPTIVRAMLRKEFRGFRLQVVRPEGAFPPTPSQI